MSNIKQFLVVAILFFVSFSLVAEQFSFSKIDKGGSHQFSYQWLDHQKKTQQIYFEVSNSVLFNKFRNFKVFKPKLAKKHINKQVVRHFNKSPIEQVVITYNNQDDSIVVQGRDLKAVRKAKKEITTLTKELTESYLKENWYHNFTTHHDTRAIKPDHVTISSLSTSDLKPLRPIILEKVSVKNIRQATDFVLGFVQNIPYSTLNSRVNSSGAGFNAPLKLLWENQGDCDSKVTLTSAILRSLMPRVNMVLVFINNHALIGIETPAEANDITITLDGVTYLLGEPTGPALLPLGQLDQVSELAILQEQYTAEKLL